MFDNKRDRFLGCEGDRFLGCEVRSLLGYVGGRSLSENVKVRSVMGYIKAIAIDYRQNLII